MMNGKDELVDECAKALAESPDFNADEMKDFIMKHAFKVSLYMTFINLLTVSTLAVLSCAVYQYTALPPIEPKEFIATFVCVCLFARGTKLVS